MVCRVFALVLIFEGLLPYLAAQQQMAASAASTIGVNQADTAAIARGLAEIQRTLKEQAQQIELQKQRLDEQAEQIAILRAALAVLGETDTQSVELESGKLRSAVYELRRPAGSLGTVSASAPKPQAPPVRQSPGEAGDTPLSIRFGNASLTPGGWVDFTGYFRSTDVGSGLGTAFASIPYGNTVAGGLSETRFTAQNSRITLRADENFGGTRVFGYAEADFNGYMPSNGYVSTNSSSMRLRVYFTDVARGRWEILGGQSWSLVTPNRSGLSPFLSEIYNTLHLDTNYQVGLTYARQTQLRAAYHFSPDIALGLSAENPEQYSGSAATFPALFSTAQTDLNSSTGAGGGTATPTLHPDIIAKLTANAGWFGRRWHFETSGLLTPVAILTPASVTGNAKHKDIREGGGVGGAVNAEIARNLHFILTGFWTDGGGRYIGGLGPGFVVAQQGAKTSPFAAQLLHSGSGIASAEWRASRATLLSLTFSEAYFGRRFSRDPSTGNYVGYGFPGSANSNNRVLHETSFATQTTLWKQPGYGAVQVITQSSYILRAPWYATPDAPKNAHAFAGYANLRYVLP